MGRDGQGYVFGGEKASVIKRNMARIQRDRFAELLSQDLPIPVIRERMGLTNGRAQQIMKAIRDGLGPQAQ
jgi:hypothetical protein